MDICLRMTSEVREKDWQILKRPERARFTPEFSNNHVLLTFHRGNERYRKLIVEQNILTINFGTPNFSSELA